MTDFKHIKNFSTFSQRLQMQNEEAKSKEKSGAQSEYAEFFLKLLQEFDVSSPNELSDEKKKQFFDKLSTGYTPGKGVTPAGEKMVKESINEEEIKDDDSFKEFAMDLLKKAHPDDFDQVKADDTISGLLSKKEGDDYGTIIGMLQKSLS